MSQYKYKLYLGVAAPERMGPGSGSEIETRRTVFKFYAAGPEDIVKEETIHEF